MPVERARVIGLLDAFQAAERAGADALGRWHAVCRDPRLRAGLRVIEKRDRGHAALAEARLRALGGEPVASPSRELAALCAVVGDPGISDRSKLTALLARSPARGAAPLGEVVAGAAGDPETHALLASIDDEERVTLAWLYRMRDALEREEG
jgi:hypothetical protein